jgi:hypothetical protein
VCRLRRVCMWSVDDFILICILPLLQESCPSWVVAGLCGMRSLVNEGVFRRAWHGIQHEFVSTHLLIVP